MSEHLQAYIGYGVDLGRDLPTDEKFGDLDSSFRLYPWCHDKIVESLDLEEEITLYEDFQHRLDKEISFGDEDWLEQRKERQEEWIETEEGQRYVDAKRKIQNRIDPRLEFFGYGKGQKKWAVLWEDTHVSADLLAGQGTSFRLNELELTDDPEEIREVYDRFWDAINWKPEQSEPSWLLIPDHG